MSPETIEPEVIPKQWKNLRPFPKGNPGQRPGPKGPYLAPLLKKLINKDIRFEDPSTQKLIRGKVKDAVVWRLLLNATQGDNAAIKEIFDRLDGQARKAEEDQNVGGRDVVVIFASPERSSGDTPSALSI